MTVEYDFFVSQKPDMYFRKYLAKITGPDPNFRLRRHFLHWREISHGETYAYYLYHLTDGIYERVVKYYDAETNAFVSKERRWIIAEGDAIAEYKDDEFDYDSVLCYVANPHCLEV